MAPRKKVHAAEADKQKAWTAKQQQAGKKRICVWITAEAADALKAKATGKTQAEVIENLLLGKKQENSKDP